MGIPPAGGTRVIERAPKHLAMLVDRTRPDRKFDLKGTVNVGRGKDNQVVLDHPTVSRQHAWVKGEGEEFSVFDVGSANGTFVNDERVEEPHRLENGDVVRFGEMEFVFTKVF
jgi:pSer/pThr/pTyr-binding forkhead associated (FHA) protein